MGFVPAYEQAFPNDEGDVLAELDGGQLWVTKIVKVFRLDLEPGETYTISGMAVTAPEADYLLGAAVWVAQSSCASLEEARQALRQNRLEETLGVKAHTVMRASGLFAEDKTKVGEEPVLPEERQTYETWQARWDRGEYTIS